MGHGASVAGARTCSTIFTGEELLEKWKVLSLDENCMLAFVNFIKSSEWMDNLARPTPRGEIGVHSEKSLFCNAIHAYHTDDTVRHQLDQQFAMCFTPDLTPEGSTNNVLVTAARKCDHLALNVGAFRPWGRHGSYLSMDNFCHLTESEVIAVLFGILLPMFDMEDNFERYLICGNDVEDYDCAPSRRDQTVYTKSSKHAQECLLSCAAAFDEEVLLSHLCEGTWLHVVNAVFDEHPLPISVTDINHPSRPFIYVNDAFVAVSGYSRKALLGKNLSLLNGPETEPLVLEHLQEAQRTGQSCKVAIVHYTAKKRRFVNMVSLKMRGGHAYAVHCDTDRPEFIKDIQMVDDVLMLLSYVVHAPPAIKLQRGQSWIPNLADLHYMSRVLRLSSVHA